MSEGKQSSKRRGKGKTNKATAIDPAKLYRFPYFREVAGLTPQRIQWANREFGIKPVTHDWGPTRWIQGSDGIAFIKAVAAAIAAAKKAEDDAG